LPINMRLETANISCVTIAYTSWQRKQRLGMYALQKDAMRRHNILRDCLKCDNLTNYFI